MGDTERVTLADIAAETGMSLTTISKVLNGRGDVAPTTRARIETHLQRRGYTRRGGSRGGFIEVVLHELDTNWSLEVISGVRDAAASAGLTVTLSVSGDRHSPGPDWLNDVVQRRPAGVVLVFAGLKPDGRRRLTARGIPFVLLDPAGDPEPGIPAVGSANWSGGVAATRHLIDLGHREIGVITGPDDMMSSLARLDGYSSAMRAAHLAVRPEWIRFGDFRIGGGERAGRELLALRPRPTAVFAGSDLQALGMIEAARQVGLDVPADLSVVGFDDIPMASILTPPLTTIRQPLRLMAEEATRLVLRIAGDRSHESTRIDLATTLVVRGTTAPPR
jgi:LacI family transcriptional regulator, xylobiose transport system transcriptional regulator